MGMEFVTLGDTQRVVYFYKMSFNSIEVVFTAFVAFDLKFMYLWVKKGLHYFL